MATDNLGSGLRHRVTLQQPVLTPDGAGGSTRTWSDVATLWAQIVPIMQRNISTEKFVDGRLEAITTHHVTLRYYSGIAADMRLLYEGRALNIVAIINVDERDAQLQILAREGEG